MHSINEYIIRQGELEQKIQRFDENSAVAAFIETHSKENKEPITVKLSRRGCVSQDISSGMCNS